MESTALVLYGAVGLGLLALLFLFYELRNAPYSDEPEPVPAQPEPRRALPLRP
ncbi:hypothetical protein EEDFHM_03076 [Methylorubrum populi]